MTNEVLLPNEAPDLRATWEALCELANEFSGTWTLIGAQMVALHAVEHGRVPPRRSDDVDALVEARTVARSMPSDLAAWLLDHDYRQDPPGGLDGLTGHRFRRPPAVIDVLAPDHLGPRADLRTVPPSHTVAVPGGRRALDRTEFVPVRVGDVTAALPRPDLIGALIVKSRAVEVDDAPRNQRVDLAFLYSLIEDPRSLAEGLTGAEHGVLSSRRELRDPGHQAWRSLGQHASDGVRAFAILTGNSS